jgi:hypothetical protein
MKALLFLGFFAVFFCPPAFAGPPFPPVPFPSVPLFLPGVPVPIGPDPAQSQNMRTADGQLNRREKELTEQLLWPNQMMEQQDWGSQITEQQLLVNEILRKELKEADQKKTAGEPKREPLIIVGK